MVQYDLLDGVDHEVVYQAFLDAFSDYQVNVNPSCYQFEQMLKQRGYEPTLSLGAFDHGRLVGFVLNGYRTWNGIATAYDLGTGVIAPFRKQGITSHILRLARERFGSAGIQQYLLEVITSNTAAVQLYQKNGFTIQRELECYERGRVETTRSGTYAVEHVPELDWERLKDFWDFTPSWQNSTASIRAVPEDFIYSVVRQNGSIVGYGVMDKARGDIPQIAVENGWRNRGIGSSLVADLIQNTASEKISVLNVELPSKSVAQFLLGLEFQFIVSQYEMMLSL